LQRRGYRSNATEEKMDPARVEGDDVEGFSDDEEEDESDC
jgi:hypothetical protein